MSLKKRKPIYDSQFQHWVNDQELNRRLRAWRGMMGNQDKNYS